MKELTSNHDDMDKRLAIFFGLGAFLMSSLVGLLRGYTLEGFLLQGVVVLVLAVLAGYLFGVWLRATLRATQVEEELPEGTERVTRNAETLEEGSLVVPGTGETVVDEETPNGEPGAYRFEELNPADLMAAAPTVAPAPEASAEPEGDLPPPPVPGWLK